MEERINRDTLITMLSDSSLFGSGIESINCDKNGIYFTDYNMGNLLFLDPSLHLKAKIGKFGEGPKEMIGASRFYKTNSSFRILDEGSNSIKSYSFSGDYIYTTQLPSNITPAYWGRFVYNDSLYYIPCTRETPIIAFDKNGKIVYKIGHSQEGEIGGSILLSNKSKLFSIGVANPFIKKYSFQGDLLETLDFSDVPFVEELCRDKNNSPNSFYKLIKDACIDNENVYLLILDRIFYFSAKEDIMLKQIYLLPHGHYSTFGVYENEVYLFNSKDVTIERFIIG